MMIVNKEANKMERDLMAERIRNRRIELGMTQEELALKVGYHGRSTINKIEKDTRNMQIDKVTEFAKALRVSPAYLMGWDDEEGTFGEDIDRQTKKSTVEEAFNLLNPDHQKAVLDLMQTLLAAEKR